MIRSYLNQEAMWHRATGKLNENAEPVYAAPKTISVRWEGKRRLVRSKDGREVVSEARVFCIEAVQTGDLLEYGGRAWPVIAVFIVPGLNGGINHYEVAL
ncbi:MAG TPA: hypothetical protein GX004_08880 [Firmicutes bacterium]|nr:hypothetical protein [Bacillota bacterium]